MGKHEIANRLRFLSDNLTQGLVEQFIAEFASDVIERRALRIFRLKPHFHNFIGSMLKVDKAVICKFVDDLHQGRLVIDPKVDLRKKALTFRL